MTDLDVLWGAARKLERFQAKWERVRREKARQTKKQQRRKALPPLLFFTDPIRTPFPENVLDKLPRGSGIVFRAFGAPDATERARRLGRLAKRRGVRFFVGADIALAIAARADGLHLPERLAHRAGWNRRLRPRFLVTAAAHGPAAARLARRAGVDAIVLSSVFASASPSAGPPLGPRRFASLVRTAGAPCYALGGVNPRTVRKLSASGAIGIAAVGALSPPDPARTCPART